MFSLGDIHWVARSFYVQEYRNKKGVSNAQGSMIEPISDIDVGDVSADDYTNEEAEIEDVIIVAVPKLEHCIQCKTDQVEPLQGNQGRCTNLDCMCLQRYNFCRLPQMKFQL